MILNKSRVNKSSFIVVSASLLVLFAAFSCKRGCTDINAENYNASAKKDNGSCIYYQVPTTYEFVDEYGNNTVSFTGQQIRLDMLSEMVAIMKSANTQGTTIKGEDLKNMFANSNYVWDDIQALGINESTKQLKNKCAGGDVTITDLFDNYIDSIASLSSLDQVGSAGTAGVYPNDGVKGPYLMNANGLEYHQWIEKGLMSSVFYYQMTEVYLGDGKMNVDNTSAVDSTNGKYYTTMEHHWDEAYGYFTSEIDYPSSGTDRFWGKYAAGRENVLGSQTKIMEAFLKGRTAIINNDFTERDAQRMIIKDEMEKVVAGTAIHYLNQAINNLTKNTTRNHVLSEATAFIDGLKYGANCIDGNSISQTEITEILNMIGTDYNNVTLSDLQAAKNKLSGIFGMDAVKDVL